MNTMTHSAWTVLEELAGNKVTESREKVTEATSELNRIIKQKLQLLELLEEYTTKLQESQVNVHSITESFALEVIYKEEKTAEEVLNDREDQLIDALKEQKKAEFLSERQTSILKASKEKAEQRQLDELGISRFNQSTTHGINGT
ncbi:MAG: hypothetical protein VXA09_06500 [Burkholderiaceae bacterium]